MSFNWKSGKLTILALIWLVGTGVSFAPAQTSAPTAKNTQAAPGAPDEDARLKKYLDKDGGYKAKDGGYYNPKAGTYTDKNGGIVDNWGGYTYIDGSYKSDLGDFYDASAKTYKLADGRVTKVENLTAAEAIKALRDNVTANGGYDKDLTLKSMMMRIKLDHPLVPVKPKP
jgi:hypothetical protein